MKVRSDFDKVNHLVLPYPRGFDNEYENLTRFFEDLIQLIPDEIHQYVIVNNKSAGEIIKLMNPKKNIDTICIDGFNEIWLRDILGFPVGDKIVKPIFKPTYYKNVYTDEYLSELSLQTDQIIEIISGKKAIEMSLVMDGGNLITNGDIAIITDKVIRDNSTYSEQEIRQIIQDYLGVVPVFMELSKNDILGHSDGYAAFVNKEHVLISSYPNKPFLSADIDCVNKLIEKLDSRNLKVSRIHDRPVDEKVNSIHNTSTEYLLSARGNYINFLNLNGTIVLPAYTLPNKTESIRLGQLNVQTLEALNLKTLSLNCDLLAKLGGVLRCVSLVI